MEIIKNMTNMELFEEYKRWGRVITPSDEVEKLVIELTRENLEKEIKRRLEDPDDLFDFKTFDKNIEEKINDL